MPTVIKEIVEGGGVVESTQWFNAEREWNEKCLCYLGEVRTLSPLPPNLKHIIIDNRSAEWIVVSSHLEARLKYTPPSLHLNMFAINHLLYLIITSGPTFYMSHEINRREKKTVFKMF